MTRLPESVDQVDIVMGVMFQDGPLNGNRSMHDGISTPRVGLISVKCYDQTPDQSGLLLRLIGVIVETKSVVAAIAAPELSPF